MEERSQGNERENVSFNSTSRGNMMNNDAGEGRDDIDTHLILHLPDRESEDMLS